MEQTDQQGIEENAAEAPLEPQSSDAQSGPAPAVQPPAKAPRKRRTASAPAGAPPAAPIAEPVTTATPPGLDASDEGSPEAASAAEGAATVRKRATRSRKAAPDSSADDLSVAESSVSPPSAATDAGHEAAVIPPPVRATRSRRRAATAEAGPAAPVPDAQAAPVVAAPSTGSSEAVQAADAAGTTVVAETGADTVPASARTPRTRRRAATAAAGPAAAGAPDVIEPGADGATAGAGDGAAPDEAPTRTRRATGRGRGRRASEPVEAADAEDQATPGAGTAVVGEAAKAEPAGEAAQAQDPAGGASGTNQAAVAPNGEETEDEAPADGNRFDPFAVPESPLSLLFHAPDLATVSVPSVKVASSVEEPDDESEDSGRRSRRSRRGRGRSRGDSDQGNSTDTATGQAESSGAGTDDAAADESSDRRRAGGPEEGPGVTSRRRRRRRRGDQDLELTGGEDDDPPNTVTRVRAPRQSAEPASDQVTSVRGSTRLEAKKQRRRESRDTGRRRQIITEAEFLARRESVDRQMIVRQRDDRIQIGVLEDGILGEHFVSRTQQDSLIGNVYLGKVQNVLPSMEAAFVDIGRGRNAVLYAGEVNWDAAGLDGQPRRIELALKSGDPVLVQVTKDPVGHKGARLTSQISLPGRYLVYVPGGSMTGISRKLPDVERNRLKRILKDRLPENAGVIVRTAAEGASEEELTHDINRLRAQWEEIERKSGSTKILAPELLYGEPDLTIKVVRDVFNEDFSKLVVSGEEAWDTIEAYVMYVAPDLVGRLEKWTSDEDIFAASRIDEQIAKALERKVFLPSGGSLVIDRTEAMTVVDVNTGKFTGSGGNLEETVTKNNLEAAEEVVRQLRLRDIGGIIVIDFIDMVLEANRDLVLRRLVECLGRDRTKHQVAEVTSLGLVQMTRKRMGTGLLEVFGEDCENCAGRGVVTYMEPVEHHHASAPEVQQQPRQDRPSRSERKRSRGRGQQDEAFVAAPAPVLDDPDRAAKAEAARAALASIAAATHHAHEEPSEDVVEDVDIEVTEAVLTINGETVTLPRAESRRVEAEVAEAAPATRLTLDSLSEAFNRKVPEDGGRPAVVTDEGVAATADGRPEQPATSGTSGAPATVGGPSGRGAASPPVKAPARRARRVASSAQGAGDTRIETQDGTIVDQPSGNRHVVTSRPAPARPESGAEPLIFGVGIPASQL